MSRRSLVGIEMAIVVAEKQGCDVLSATGFDDLPDWGRRAGTVVLLKQPEAKSGLGDHSAWRITTHYGTDDEFDQGYYHGDVLEAWKDYVKRCERHVLDAQIYASERAARS